MPKVSVYMPDELYRRAKDRGLSISAITQRAVDEALRIDDNRAWIEEARSRSPRTQEEIDTEKLMDEVREEFGA